MTVDLTAKVADAAAAIKFQESFRSVVNSFHNRVSAHELEDGVVLREGVWHALVILVITRIFGSSRVPPLRLSGWLIKYPKVGRPRKRFFSLAKTVKGTKIDSFLSLYYFVDESKTVMKGMYPLNKFCKATVLKDKEPARFVWESQHVSRAGKATDQIRVELKASNAVQANSWANLVSRVNACQHASFPCGRVFTLLHALASPCVCQTLYLLL